MTFIDILQAYFRGERIEAFFYILPAGLLLIGMGITALVSDRGAFGWSMAIPLLLFGLIAAGTGLQVGTRTASQVAALEAQYAQNPAQMLATEIPRMEKVNANWPIYLTTWAALVVIGLVIRFASSSDWAHGLGPALILVGAIGFLIDGFAERRARPYTEALTQLAAAHESEHRPSANPDQLPFD